MTPGLLDLGALWALVQLDRPELKQEPWLPVTEPRLSDTNGPPDLFRVLRGGDVLVHHPYDSFSSSVEAFVEQAAHDPAVLAIKQTLYRTSTQESPILRALIRAAELGKQVVALVELKARFDEEANIAYARELEQAGVHVVYGVVGLKTHAKISLVVRREAEGVRRYAHVGTGNYNPVTATLYEDLGLLTADARIGADLTDLFNLLTGYSRQREYRSVIVAPHHLRPRMLELMRGQAHPGGRIVFKMNSLVDPDLIDGLYEASEAGADVDLIVRGICCLRPGIPGLSERIRVRSLVGRYLEHSRIFRFGEHEERTHYIGSADLMQRNLDRRVEALVPVSDPELASRLDRILEVLMEDDVLAWTLDVDGTWSKVRTERGLNAQQRLQEMAVERARGPSVSLASVERGAKLAAPPGFRLPLLGGEGVLATANDAVRITTVYLDTPDLRAIVRWGASLRHRDGHGWTVKLPPREEDPLLARSEHVFPGDARRAPEEATGLLRAYVRAESLSPVARLQTIRSTVDLTDELGRLIAHVVDDEVSVMDGRRVASRFRELELELAPGVDPAIAEELLARLHTAGAGPIDNVPKIRRALGPRADAPPDVVVPAVSTSATVEEVVRRALGVSAIRLLRHDAGVRLGDDPEDVHQARVATRRLRSDLRTFRDVLEPAFAASLRDELRWLGAALGAVRDADVLRERLHGRAASLPAVDRAEVGRLVVRLDERRDAARGPLLAAMAEPRYVNLLDGLVAAATTPAVLPEVAGSRAAEVLRVAPVSPWKHLRSAVGAARDDPADAALHAARIRAKQARYAAEALAPVFGKQAEAFAEAAASLQGVLGEHQDAVVAGAWLREAASASPRQAFVSGELAALESAAARKARAAWPDAWKAVSRKRLRFWA